ncbi:MAG: PaaI family thioesterase [Acidimicrobiales bacterium]
MSEIAIHGASRTTADSPRNRLAAAVRRISALVVGRPLEDGDLSVAAAVVSSVADDLERAAGPGKAPRVQPDHTGHPQDFFPTSPVIGYANPVAPPVDFWAVRTEEGQLELRGRAVYDAPYEGPPTCVHGGVIAELFDELLGSVNILTGRAGMTGTLTVRYRRPTPLLAPLDIVARQTGTEGRKIFAWGGVYHGGQLTAEAEGIFIEVGVEKMLQIVSANTEEATGERSVAPPT